MAATGNEQREHHWDAMRALLMILGIPYHVALAYRAGHEWIVQPGTTAAAFTYIAECIHIFRMPAFFVIAGYFAAMLLARRDPAAWLSGRCVRLGVPLVASMLTLVPLLNLACELSSLPLNEAIASWKHQSATSGGYWVRHLWFLIVLLQCSTAAALLMWWKPALRTASVPAALDRWMARYFPLVLLAVAIVTGLWEAGAIEAFYHVGLATNVPQQILRLDDLIEFAPYFSLGMLIQRAPETLDRLTRFSPTIALLAVATLVHYVTYVDSLSPAYGRFGDTIAALATTQLLIALARRFADRPRPSVDKLVEASFVIYLVHLPLVIILVALAKDIAVPAAVKAGVMMPLVLLLSYGAWVLVRSSPLLRFLFDGIRPAPSPARPHRQNRVVMP